MVSEPLEVSLLSPEFRLAAAEDAVRCDLCEKQTPMFSCGTVLMCSDCLERVTARIATPPLGDA